MWFFSCCSHQSLRKVGFASAPPAVHLVDFGSPVVNTLSLLWQPLITWGQLQHQGYLARPLFKTTTLDKVDTNELTTIAARICRSETSSLEIGSLLLDSRALSDIQKQIDVASLFPGQKVHLKVRTLMVVPPDNPNRQSIDPIESSEDRVGVVEALLNSTFQGGELQVSCNGRFLPVTSGPYNWLAVRADASCSINPVTSGVRVSLIYDIFECPITISSTLLFAEGSFDFVHKTIVNTIYDSHMDMQKLVEIAEQLRPELVGKCQLTIDPCVLNSSTLAELGSKADLGGLFPAKKVVVKLKRLVIDRAEGDACMINATCVRQHSKRYLGTLVLVVASTARPNTVYYSRADASASLCVNSKQWYAYTADTAVTFDPINFGMRVSLYYGIYAAKPSVVVHDPLSNPTSGSDISFLLTRPIISVMLREQVSVALATEFSNAQGIIITLQHLFPEGPAHKLWNTYPSYLQGGDRALYEILTGTSFSELYDVQLVDVAIRCEYDQNLQRDVIVPKQCTFTPFTDPRAAPVKHAQQGSVKLIVATTLIDRFRVRKYTHNKVYQVLGLYISKKM